MENGLQFGYPASTWYQLQQMLELTLNGIAHHMTNSKNLVPQNVQIPLVLYEAANQNFFVTCLKLTRAEKINSLFLFKNSIIDVPLVGRLILLDNHWKHVLLALNKRIQ